MAIILSVACTLAIICSCSSERTEQRKLGSSRVVDFHVAKCDKKATYPLTASDVQLYFISDWSVAINGTLESSVELKKGIQANIEMDYLSSIGWVRVPCFAVFHLGSCTYPDVCAWVPNEGTHEEAVIEGTNICRCPIHKGTCKMHLVPRGFEFSQTGVAEVGSLLSGQYGGSIAVKSMGQLLSCYNFNFTLINNVSEKADSLNLLYI